MKALRRSRIGSVLDIRASQVLEIGALDAPTFSRDECDVRFLDYASTEELARKGVDNPRYRLDRIVAVDYICPTPDYDRYIHDRFDLVIANHVIEHVPDTLGWLSSIEALLRPGGKLFLSVPDKRYTFDIARRCTNFIDLMRHHEAGTLKPGFYEILEHFYYHKRITAEEAWAGAGKERLAEMRFSPKDALRVAEKFAMAPYADVHCHVFTSESFQELIDVLDALDLLPLRCSQLWAPVHGSNEFHVLMCKR